MIRKFQKINKNSIFSFLFLFLIFILLIPYIHNIFYTIPSADDFDQVIITTSNIFTDGISKGFYYWKHWQGTFSYVILSYWFKPLRYFGYESHFAGIEIIVMFLLFILSVIFFVKTLLKELLNCKNNAIHLAGVFVTFFLILNTADYPEIFFWYSGAIMYLTAVSAGLALIALQINYLKENVSQQLTKGILISFLGFFSCMEFNIPVYICSSYLLLLWKKWKEKRKITPKDIFPFLFCLAGGLICVLAPGNFKRQSNIDNTGIHPLQALIYTFHNVFSVIKEICDNPVIVWGLILVTIISIYLYQKKVIICGTNTLLALLYTVAIAFVGIFPCALAYSAVGLPNRISFIVNTFFIIGISYSCVTLGCHAGRFIEKISIKECIYISLFCCVCIYTCYLNNSEAFLNISYIKQIYSMNSVKECHDAYIDIYHEIDNSVKSDFSITISGPQYDSTVLLLPDFNAEWQNIIYERYFEKNDIQIIRQ